MDTIEETDARHGAQGDPATGSVVTPVETNERRAYHQAYYRRVRKSRYDQFRSWLTAIKGDVCSECGDTFEPERLHFHHLDPSTKLFTISRAWTRGREVVLAEIAKCVVVCDVCHNRIEPRIKRAA